VSALAITFDDGPDAVWTERLLDRLRTLRAKATFFPIAPRASANPGLIARMRAEGHAVGLHCDQHIRHDERDLPWLRADTARALQRLAKLGISPTLWRTPWGLTTADSRLVAAEHGLRLVGWTVDTHDWRGDTATEMFELTRGELREGAVVLAHDGVGPGALRSDARQTLAYLELLAEHAEREGLRLEGLE
jgi:peptidoglycan/xylan/chitin deacetylase (PgdA/CDA1 family)